MKKTVVVEPYPVANGYVGSAERIIEWKDTVTGAGGLISFSTTERDDKPVTTILLYRMDGPIVVQEPQS